MMLHPIKRQVRAVRRRAYRLVLVHGLGWWAALTLLVAFLCGLTDYLVRFQDDGARALAFATVVCFLAVAFWRIVLPGLRQRTSDLQVAQLIERRFPQLQDRLSSSVAFLGEPSSKSAMGSPDLQESVIAETDRLVATLNIFDCLEGRAARRAVGVLALVAATTAAISALDLAAARMASHRLLLPWSDAAWPRRNRLEFVDPPRLLARGDDLEVVLIDRNGHLPATALLQTRLADNSELQTRELHQVNGQMVARLENVTRAFKFRAIGGDDKTMAWHELEVREPVQMTDVEIFVEPPEYTGLPAGSSHRLIRAWAGSAIRLHAELSGPAEIVAIESSFSVVPDIQLAPNGRSFQIPPAESVPWVPAESGVFQFRIKDRGGLAVTSELSFDLTLLSDMPPTVSLEVPAENESYLSGAEVPVRVVIKDDLAVWSASLMCQNQAWPVFPAPPATERSQPHTPPGPDGDRHVIDTVWKLDTLQLQPGDVVEYYVVAADGKPQSGTSEIRHLTIISAKDFDNLVDRDQAEFRRRIEKALMLQLRAQAHLDKLAKATDWSAATPDQESLQTVQWGQQQIRQMISGTDGALPLAEQLLLRLANNHADKPDVEARLNAVVPQLRALDGATLPTIEHQLGTALKVARARALAPATTELSQSQAAVRQAQQGQQEVVVMLEAILHRFAKWTNVRRIATDVADMQRQQEQLIQDTDALQTVGKARDDLTQEELELLRPLVQRQAQLARQADRLLLELEQLGEQAASEDPAFAEMVSRAIAAARQTDVAAAAHEARRKLEENQIGSATSHQSDVRAGLRQISHAISQREPDPAATLPARVQEWLLRQQSLVSATGELNAQLADPPSVPERQRLTRDLAARQAALAEEVAAAARSQVGPVIQFTLNDAGRMMTAAAGGLARAEVGPTVQEWQQSAQSRLLRLSAALLAASRKPEDPVQDPAASPGDPAGQQPETQNGDRQIGIADLQLLRALQLEINQQTSEIDRARDTNGLLTPQYREELAEIEGRQKQLVNLVVSLLGEEPTPAGPAKPPANSDLDDALRKAKIPGFSED